MPEHESHFKNFQEAKAAFEMQLAAPEFDLKTTQDLAEACINLLSSEGRTDQEKDLLAAQKNNLLRDFRTFRTVEAARIMKAQPVETEKITAEIKQRLRNYVDRLTQLKSR